MNVEQRKVVAGWALAQQNILYAVAAHGGKLIWIESPEEAGIEPGRPRQAVLRVFTSREEAEWYLLKVEANTEDEMAVVEIELEKVFYSAPRIDIEMRKVKHASLRVELCYLNAPSSPVYSVDTLWTPSEERN